MRIRNFTLIACAICFVVGILAGLAQALANSQRLAPLARRLGFRQSNPLWFYQQMAAFHRRADANVPAGSVIFIGDSHLQGLCVTAVAAGAVNYGIGGDTAEGVLARIPDYTSVRRARAVVLAVGGNDLPARANDEILDRFAKIMDLLPAEVPVLFCSLIPASRQSRAFGYNGRVRELNRRLRELCGARRNRFFADLTEELADAQGDLREELQVGDGMHLNSEGGWRAIHRLRICLDAAALHAVAQPNQQPENTPIP